MKGWNNRVCTKLIKKPGKEAYRSFQIYEVYYDDKGKPNAYAETPVKLISDEYDELKSSYDLIKYAFDKPILDLNNFPNEFKIS